MPGPSTKEVINLACQYHIHIAFGILEAEAGCVYCTHVLVNGAGVVGKQRKIHSAEEREPDGRKCPGWAGIISPWGRVFLPAV